MPAADAGIHRSSSFLNALLSFFQSYGSALLAVGAFALSLYSLYDARLSQRYVSQTDSLKTEYDLYLKLVQLEHDNPYLSHLFVPTPRAYFNTREQIRATFKEVSPQDRARLTLQERAIVNYIFTSFEETYFHWQTASDVGNQSLAELLKQNLDFFKYFLCNSRLIWYWSRDTDPLDRHFAEEAVSYYRKNIVKDCSVTPDESGPFILTPK